METQFTKREFAKTQTSLLTKSMLIAGIFFAIIGAGSFGFSKLFVQNEAVLNSAIWLTIFLLLMVAGMVISMLWTKVLWDGKAGVATGIIYTLYVACESVAFGYLFALAEHAGVPYVWTSFVITGGVFLFCALFAKLLSMRGIMTLGKMMGAAALAMSVMLIAALITLIVAMAANNWTAFKVQDMLFDIIMFIMALVSAGYIIIDIWSISKASEFQDYVGENLDSGYVWYVGYRLLSDLLNFVLIVIWFMIKLARRAD